MMKPTFQFLTFQQWCEANPDLGDIERECQMCDGTGLHTCECGDEHDCGWCHGSKTEIDISLKDMYKRQRELDQARLEKYLATMGVKL
jgi:hypothetical protein